MMNWSGHMYGFLICIIKFVLYFIAELCRCCLHGSTVAGRGEYTHGRMGGTVIERRWKQHCCNFKITILVEPDCGSNTLSVYPTNSIWM